MSALPAAGLLSIGDTLDLLKPEFSDLTISKLRFLENEGLVEPQRTASGYRKYTHHDIARLRFVLTAQRDHYLPLRVIKNQLENLDRGLEVSPSGHSQTPKKLSAVESLPQISDFAPNSKLQLTVSELIETANSTLELFTAAQNFGLIPQTDFYSADHVAVLVLVTSLGEFGIEPRHLRQFKLAADNELGLISQVASPIAKKKDENAAAEAADKAREVAALTVGLHTALVRSGLDSTLG
jgi:DNA-binding transcriptional MerR regulator